MKWPTMPAAIRQPTSTTAMIAAARPRRLFFGRAGFGALGGFSRLARRGDSPRGVFSFAFFAGAGASGSSGGSPANLPASSSSAEKSLS